MDSLWDIRAVVTGAFQWGLCNAVAAAVRVDDRAWSSHHVDDDGELEVGSVFREPG